MKHLYLILAIMIVFIACKTGNKKHTEKVFKSTKFKNTLLEHTKLKMNARSINKENSFLIKSELISDYNSSLIAETIGKSSNIDTIVKRVNRNSDLYKDYLIADAFWYYSRDSLEAFKYEKEKDSILKQFH